MADNKSITELFVLAYSDVENPELDSTNDYFNSKYASLKSTLGVIRDACKSKQIIYRQTLVKNEEEYEIHSCVMNSLGEKLELSIFPIVVPPNPQSFGSNLTYTKRQQAQIDWGIVGEEDDDANLAADSIKSQKVATQTKTKSKPANQRREVTADNKALMDAKQRLWDATKIYADIHGMTTEQISNGIKKRPNYAETAEFFNEAALEFEEANLADTQGVVNE